VTFDGAFDVTGRDSFDGTGMGAGLGAGLGAGKASKGATPGRPLSVPPRVRGGGGGGGGGGRGLGGGASNRWNTGTWQRIKILEAYVCRGGERKGRGRGEREGREKGERSEKGEGKPPSYYSFCPETLFTWVRVSCCSVCQVSTHLCLIRSHSTTPSLVSSPPPSPPFPPPPVLPVLPFLLSCSPFLLFSPPPLGTCRT
jgi:hypothetical protein